MPDEQLAQAQSAWQPISTASKVGMLLLWDGKSVQSGWWDANLNGEEPGWTNGACEDYGYERDVRITPTHWMPLPQPPTNDNPKATASSPEAIQHVHRTTFRQAIDAARGKTQQGQTAPSETEGK